MNGSERRRRVILASLFERRAKAGRRRDPRALWSGTDAESTVSNERRRRTAQADAAPGTQRRRIVRGVGADQVRQRGPEVETPRIKRPANAHEVVVAVMLRSSAARNLAQDETIAAARLLANRFDGRLVAVLQRDAVEPGRSGIDEWCRWPFLAASHPERAVAWLQKMLAELRPRHVLFENDAIGRDLMRRMAANAAEIGAADLTSIGEQEITWNAFGGRRQIRQLTPKFMTIASGAVEPPAQDYREGSELPSERVVADLPSVRIRELELVRPDRNTIALSEAGFVVGGGGGVGDWPLFGELVEALSAVPGGSRVACDAGRLPRSRQIGASGTALSADCYLALGISGAVQHLQGIRDCGCVIAVNTDERAPIFARADLGIIADVDAVARSLIERIKRTGEP